MLSIPVSIEVFAAVVVSLLTLLPKFKNNSAQNARADVKNFGFRLSIIGFVFSLITIVSLSNKSKIVTYFLDIFVFISDGNKSKLYKNAFLSDL